jgi:hypothetical protein
VGESDQWLPQWAPRHPGQGHFRRASRKLNLKSEGRRIQEIISILITLVGTAKRFYFMEKPAFCKRRRRQGPEGVAHSTSFTPIEFSGTPPAHSRWRCISAPGSRPLSVQTRQSVRTAIRGYRRGCKPTASVWLRLIVAADFTKRHNGRSWTMATSVVHGRFWALATSVDQSYIYNTS